MHKKIKMALMLLVLGGVAASVVAPITGVTVALADPVKPAAGP